MYTVYQLNEDINMLNKLDTVIENAMLKLELSVLSEAAEDNPTKKEKEKKERKKISEVARAAWDKFIKWAKGILENLSDQITYMIRVGSGKNAKLNKTLTVSKYVFEIIPSDFDTILNDLKTAEAPDLQLLKNAVKVIKDRTITINAGEVLNIKGIYTALKSTRRELSKLEKAIKRASDYDLTVMNDIRSFYKDLINDMRTVIINTDSIKKSKNGSNEDNESQNESFIPDDMTKNEYIASIMLEAAELLKLDESAGANGAGKRFYEEKIKATQNKINSLEKKANAYRRAGYGDKGPAKEIDDLKRKIKEYKKNMSKYDTKKDYDSSIYDTKDREYVNGKRTAQLSKYGQYDDKFGYGREYSEAFNRGYFTRKDKAEKNARINKRASLQEAIDLFYDKALLCEDADEAEGYIQKAEELQKAIEDIPEETPVKQDDYITDVVGGDDEKPDLEEIKDLCDNDPDVIKLLTDDEDKSVTVDSDGETNTESYDFYDLDF